MDKKHIIIIGGGAAGMFAAINCAEMYPKYAVTVLEKGRRLLEKVKISGGGRCNVTHACFDPAELIKNYPRGSRELLAPFQRFQPRDTIAWFKKRGVLLHTEQDGRMFPVTNDSQTIVDCLLNAAQNAGVAIYTQTQVTQLTPPSTPDADWSIDIVRQTTPQQLRASVVIIATGSSHSMWQQIARLGHTILPPIPSLFTFHIQDPRLTDLSGISLPDVAIQLVNTPIKTKGALLITHWGLSGPAVLRLSAFGAVALHEQQYKMPVLINFIPHLKPEQLWGELQNLKQTQAKKLVVAHTFFGLPLRLWQRFCAFAAINETLKWADLNHKTLQQLADTLQRGVFLVNGKSTFKEEFVTCGGVALKEINFKTMQSRIVPKLFFAGEVLHIDAVTGGFNFQAAWTTAYIAAESMKLA